MKYRGLIFDIDETIIPNGALSIQSKPIIDTFASLPKDVIAIAATGRMKPYAFPIISSLSLMHDSVIANGAQIIDSISGQTIYNQPLSLDQVQNILKICKPYNYKLVISQSPKTKHLKSYKTESTTAVVIRNAINKDTQYFLKKFNSLKNVHAYSGPAWGNPVNCDISIGHIKKKKHLAIELLYKKYNLKPEEVIGVGDGINDIELFNAVGHKIAVANANPKLLEKADEIVPAQQENGIITVINKYFK